MLEIARLAGLVEEAGRLALSHWPGLGNTPQIWEKCPGDIVCEADIAVDSFLKSRLAALIPEAGWLSEETIDNADRLGRGLCWVVDPIDGTRDFVRGRKGWAVSVALVADARPVLGVLCAPARGDLWLAEHGRGASRNGIRLAPSAIDRLAGARVPADTLPRADADLVPVPRPNSIALRMGMVAADEADLCATLRWGFEWDLAAAALVATEAGAVVSDAFGRPLRFNQPDPRAFGLLVSAPGIHAAAVARLADRARLAAART